MFTLFISSALLSGCATTVYEPLETLKTEYNSVKADETISNNAPVVLYDLDRIIKKAELAAINDDQPLVEHYTYLGEKTLAMASAKAITKQNADRIKSLSTEHQKIILESRGKEVQRSQAEVAQIRQELESYKSKKSDRGTVLILDNLLFDTGGANLHPGSQKNLDPLVHYLLENSERKISIEGHTDSMGSEESNLKLSEKRANAVKQYLIFSKIEESRINTRGFGESFPVATNSTREGRQLNRRVEITILD